MNLSVVVPTLNGRDRLAASLDSLAEHAPDAEVVVVNGPSADGTTGMVRDREDVAVLVELSDRTLNVARNAGIEAATGDAVAFVGYDLVVEPTWREAVEAGLAEADVATGPVQQTLRVGRTTQDPERRTINDREVAYFNGENVAFRRPVLDDADGFDEYLQTGGARDAAHRLAALGYEVSWGTEMAVRREYEADGDVADHDWGWKYRALTYRLVKNYGLRPTVARRIVSHAVSDGFDALRGVVGGEVPLTTAIGSGRDVATGVLEGGGAGMRARARDRSPRRNPNGLSARRDRAVARYDWREE
ncbi:MAG: glycosyltransferase family A protein [Haloferacaceae archaeon]